MRPATGRHRAHCSDGLPAVHDKCGATTGACHAAAALDEYEETIALCATGAESTTSADACGRHVRDLLGRLSCKQLRALLTAAEENERLRRELANVTSELSAMNANFSVQFAEAKRLRRERDEARRDADDAGCVIGGLGYDRRECPACKRLTVIRGYICWACGEDPTMHGRKEQGDG